MAILIGIVSLASAPAFAADTVQLSQKFQSPAEPSTPERGTITGEKELKPQLDPNAPCKATYTDYAEAYMKWVEKPPSVLNECGLGRLVNFKLLQGFDPFGAMINAIKGAVCGFIKNEISDPFVNKLNAKISQANRWVDDTNDQYSSWIDETARDVGSSIYDPRSNFVKNSFPSAAAYPDRTAPNYNDPANEPEVTVPDDPGNQTDEDILDDGGSITVGENEDGNDVIVTGDPTGNDTSLPSTDWENIYNLYE